MTTTTKTPVTCVSRVGRKLNLRGPYNDSANEFYHSLPSARWSVTGSFWTCDATPASAHAVLNHCHGRVECDDETRELAGLHTNIAFAREMILRTEHLDQPPHNKLPLWRHQLHGYHFAISGEAAMLACAMGTGKSAIAIAAVNAKQCRKILILCPLSVLGVWRREWERHSALQPAILVADKGGVADKTQRIRHTLDMACLHHDGPTVVVVNYESAWRLPLGNLLLAEDWDAVILDESHRGKAHDSKVGKFLFQLGRKAKFRLCLTGTPMPHSPADVFGQYRFLDAGVFGTSFHRFRHRYAQMNPVIPQKVDKWINQDELAEKFASIAFRVESSVLDLPDSQHIRLECTLSSKGRRAYDQMAKNLRIEIEEGELTAANGMVKLLRLQQLTGGCMLDEVSGETLILDREKEVLLCDLLEDVDEPVVVFCRFRHDLAVVQRCTESLRRRYGEVSGSRKDLTENATMPEGVDVLGVQIASGGVGIDLTRARIGVYYSLGYSLGDFDQSMARILRPGQTRPVVYYHLVAKGTVDETVYLALDKRRDLVEVILESLRS